MSPNDPPLFVFLQESGGRHEVRYLPPDKWEFRHITPEYIFPGTVFCGRFTTYERLTTDELVEKVCKP